MLENKKKGTLPLTTNLTIAYGSDSLERNLETETINANESVFDSVELMPKHHKSIFVQHGRDGTSERSSTLKRVN